ncbi:MAG: hypothetical protein Q8N53_20725, partial [Longimicrobiales bacterium]|nr:hypothetical protein [Longimicrobiales bacterium]
MINVTSPGRSSVRNRLELVLPITVLLLALAACSQDQPLAPGSAEVGPPLFSFVSGPPGRESPPEDLALNRSGSGYPSPLGSDPGWGGGSYPWQIVDGQRLCAGGSQWACGLAFTGGTGRWPPGSQTACGWRQATIDFG